MRVREPSFAVVNGRKLAYDEIKPSQPKGTVLLLPGLASKRLGWSRQLEVFGQEYRTIALDHRDVGDSDTVEEPYTIADLADDAAALLKEIDVAKAHVVGISLGGFVALQFAARHPDQLDKLVLVSTSAGGVTHVAPQPEVLALLMPNPEMEVGERAIHIFSAIMAAEFCQAHPEEMEMIAAGARYRPMVGAAYGRQLQAAMAHDAAEALRHISVPTLVIHGDRDPLVPPENGAHLAQHIPGARHIVYPGVGHVPIIERAADFNRDVLSFLAEDTRNEPGTAREAQPAAAETAHPVVSSSVAPDARTGRRFFSFRRSGGKRDG
jgi:pimeloyl-ACP methyl ester carboxylesterase